MPSIACSSNPAAPHGAARYRAVGKTNMSNEATGNHIESLRRAWKAAHLVPSRRAQLLTSRRRRRSQRTYGPGKRSGRLSGCHGVSQPCGRRAACAVTRRSGGGVSAEDESTVREKCRRRSNLAAWRISPATQAFDERPAVRPRRERCAHYLVDGKASDTSGADGAVVHDTIDPDDSEYVCKFDLDLEMPAGYFEGVIRRMEAEPRLGTTSGKPWFVHPRTGALVPEICGDEMSVGMAKFYRVPCFSEIGGFVSQVMWDGIDCHRTRMLGWIAESVDDPALRFLHLRPQGASHKGIWTGRVRAGFGQYFMGTRPSITGGRGISLTQHPLVVGSIAMLWGYTTSTLKGLPRYGDAEFRRFLRRYQHACLRLGKAKATAQRLNADRRRFGSDASTRTDDYIGGDLESRRFGLIFSDFRSRGDKSGDRCHMPGVVSRPARTTRTA